MTSITQAKFATFETSLRKKIELAILAAGDSRRMGRSKPLLKFGSQTLLERLVKSFSSAGIEKCSVVCKHSDEELKQEIMRVGAHCILNSNPELGMANSVALALKVADSDWLAITPCDFPFLSAAIVRTCIDALGGSHGTVQPSFSGRRGHPVFVHSSLRAQILNSLEQGKTFREALEPVHTRTIEQPDGRFLADLDTPEDYAAALRELGLAV